MFGAGGIRFEDAHRSPCEETEEPDADHGAQ
jgi:hypothetical protein